MIKGLKQFICIYKDRIILFFYPLFLAFLNSNWIFTPASGGLADGWIYYAYMRYFYALAPTYPSNTHYFVERLTWIVPGYYIHQIFSPIVANYIYHLCVYYLAVFSLYGILRLLFNQRTALISALVMGSYSWFLRSVGWDYSDGIGIALMLLMLFLLTLITRSPRWKWYIFLAGMTNAAMLDTNQFWIGFAPGWIVFFLLLNHQSQKLKIKQLLLAASIFLAGNLVIVGLISTFYHSVTGDFNFLKNSIKWSKIIVNDAVNTKGLYDYFGKMPPYWHVLPVILFLAGVIRLLKSKQEEARNIFLAIIFTFVVMFSWMLFWHYTGLPYLIVFLYSSYLIPIIFILFGSLISNGLSKLSEYQYRILTITAFFILASPFILCTIFPAMEKWQGNNWLILISGFGLLVSFVTLTKKYILYLLLFCFVALSYTGGANTYVYFSDRFKNQDNYRVINDVSQEIDSFYPKRSYQDFRLWYKNDINYYTYNALGAFYLFPWGSVVNSYPISKLTWPESASVYEGNIVLLSDQTSVQAVLEEANRALLSKNASLIMEFSKRIKEGSIELTLIFAKLSLSPIPLDFGEKYDFSIIKGSNWYTRQTTARGVQFRWSGPDTRSDIQLRFPNSSKDIKIQFCAIMVMSPEIPKTLKLFVNNTYIPTALAETEECPYLYTGIIPAELPQISQSKMNLVFQLDKVMSAAEAGYNPDPSKLGLAFTWLLLDK